MANYPAHAAERRISRIDVNQIVPNPDQPRRTFAPAGIGELADSIRRYGLLSPLLVRRSEGGYQLIAGERRLRAMRQLGWAQADAIVLDVYDHDCALIAMIENLQREDLHFLDEAEAYRRILLEHALTQEELALTLCKSPSALANRLRLLQLDAPLRAFIRQSALTERHARALLRVGDEGERLALAQQAAEGNWSVRRLETQIEALSTRKKEVHRAGTRFLRDDRLVINALNDTVRQLNRIGVRATSRVEMRADSYDVIVTIQSCLTTANAHADG